MIIMYILDILFIAAFLANKTFYMRIKECEFIRYFYWAEAIIILLYMYARPCHSDSEKLVSFAIQLTSILFWYFLYYKKIMNKNKTL